ncbi:homeobox protein notochord [Rattus norvegicus]|uniref:Notochord homeobox n=1 Tax=Rattus norvegicus TaxID=10116 RepID=F1M4Z8_RAT|nr:homeobox protein notochord [Rattus norvegicus]|eukprot:NP_001178943.1 homeobox protein notochord [Rattus norvegicus]
MSSPVPQPASSGTQVQPGDLGPCPVAVSPVVPNHLARGRLESSFSVEAILARPETREHSATSLPLSTCTSLNFGSVSQYQVLPWVCSTGTWLPTYLSVGIYPMCSMSCMPGLNVTHLFCQQGLRLTGSELPSCLGPLKRAPTVNLQDHNTERHQKRVRTMFSEQQLGELEKVFAKQHNLVGKERAQLAARLHLTENQVRIWFQNRRVKYQKQQKLKSPPPDAMEEPSNSSEGNVRNEDAEAGVGS